MEKQPRYLSEEETQRMRESVEQGVKRVVHPFLRRVEAQSHIRPSKVKYKNHEAVKTIKIDLGEIAALNKGIAEVVVPFVKRVNQFVNQPLPENVIVQEAA